MGLALAWAAWGRMGINLQDPWQLQLALARWTVWTAGRRELRPPGAGRPPRPPPATRRPITGGLWGRGRECGWWVVVVGASRFFFFSPGAFPQMGVCAAPPSPQRLGGSGTSLKNSKSAMTRIKSIASSDRKRSRETL
jgi:hypothetical protein